MVENVEQNHHEHNHRHHGSNHQVELLGILVECRGTCLQLAVLSRTVLQIQIDIAVVIALLLIIYSRINQAESFTYRRYEVGCLLDGLVVVQGMIQAVERRRIIMDIPETFCQRTIGSGSLINISVARKEVEGTLGKVACQQIVWHLLDVEILEGRQVVANEEFAHLSFSEVLANRLQGVSLPVRIRMGRVASQHVAADQPVEFRLIDFVFGFLDDSSARTYIIKIVEILCRILFQLIWVQTVKLLKHRLV